MKLFGFNWGLTKKSSEELFGGRDPQWDGVRKQHLKKENLCQACLTKDNLEVHHIIPFHLRPDLELDPANLITLCAQKCHLLFGHLMNYKSYNSNVIEDCKKMQENIKNRP
jgi:5-methylcytosine-specific restriction endonuclease McrA